MLMRIGWAVPDEHFLQTSLIPYAAFAVTLPVIMLEWFDPSAAKRAAAGDDEEEEQ